MEHRQRVMEEGSRLAPGLGALAAVGLLLLGTLIPCLAGDAPADPRKDLLTSRYTESFLREKLVPRESWQPFPRASNRDAWNALREHPLNRERAAWIVEEAEAALGKPWPALPATLYMEFARDGNRSRYQEPYFERRERLATLVLAECFEHEGRFLDEIANGIWAICEESTWCIPAHASRHRGDVLQRPDLENLDLFACEAGMTLAQTHYLLEAELEGLSRALRERIPREVSRRIIEPFAADRFGSRGWLNGHNNWSPWCASNVLGAVLYLEEDRARVASLTFRLMEVVDRFINGYGEDGGCDEGPGYWNEAAGAMVVFLELLRSRTGGAIDIYDDPKIAAMGEYITHAHLTGPWFANFADADPQAKPHPGKVYRYGERVGSAGMKNLALLSMREWKPEAPVSPPLRLSGVSRPVLGPLMEIFWIPAAATPVPARHPLEVWLPDVQVLFARESASSKRGLVLAAKGGHNAESHNHNDVGHFMLFLDGQPGIIDLGRETYTRQTFSGRRYELWFTRGSGHNAPVVNGMEQRPGRSFQATNVRYVERDSGPRLSLNLEKAYPAEAGLVALEREIGLERRPEACVRVRDSFELRESPATFRLHLFSVSAVRKARPGHLAIRCRPRPLLVKHDPAMEVTIEEIPLEDPKLRAGWGPGVFRTTLELKATANKGSYALEFRAGEEMPR